MAQSDKRRELRLEALDTADIHGAKTVIRPMRLDEAPTLFRWATDSEVAPFWGGHDRYESFDEFLEEFKPYYFSGKRPELGRCFAIESEDSLIGMVATNAVSLRHRSTDIDVVIGQADFRDRGYGTDALSAFVRFLVDTVGLHRIGTGTYSHNLRAIRAYEKAGFTTEGLMRQADWVDGSWQDVVLLSILDQEIHR